MPILDHAVLADIFQVGLPVFQVEYSTITVVHGGGNVGSDFLLEHQPHAASFNIASLIGKCPRINIWKDFAVEGGKLTDAGERWIGDAVGIHRRLHAGLSLAMRE